MAFDLAGELAKLVQPGTAEAASPPPSPSFDLPGELSRLVQEDGQAKQAVPTSPSMPAPAAKEPSDYIYRSYEGSDGSKYNVYSNDGKRKKPEAFDAAIDQYASSGGKAPKGFTVLQPGGALDWIQQLYESVNQPLQSAAGNIGRHALQHATSPIIDQLRSMGIISPSTAEGVQGGVGRAGAGAGEILASQFNTLPKAASTIGMIGGTALTGGMSAGLQMLGTGLGAGLGYGAGQALGGETPDPGSMITAGAMAAASRGFTELFKWGIGLNTSELAKKQVAAGVMKVMKEKFGSTANPGILEAMGSNPSDVAKLTGIGLDAITGELKASAATLIPDIMTGLPRTLSKGAQNTLRAELRRIQDAGLTSLEGMNKPGAAQYALDSFDTAQTQIKALLVKEFKGMGVPAIQKAINRTEAVLGQYWKQLDQYKPGAMVLQALKDSSAQQGFNPLAFQKTLQNYAQPPGSLMGEVGDIARRGAPYGVMDKELRIGLPIGKALNLPGPFGNLNPSKRVGTIYAGKVEGTNPLFNIGATTTGAQAIRDFVSQKGR
jgi:hypothetical protein